MKVGRERKIIIIIDKNGQRMLKVTKRIVTVEGFRTIAIRTRIAIILLLPINRTHLGRNLILKLNELKMKCY